MGRAAAARYQCTACGHVESKWTGRCEGCGAWNTMEEDAGAGGPLLGGGTGGGAGARRADGGAAKVRFVPLAGSSRPPPRRPTGIGELDRVLGGGLVPGSAVLVGGDPGIGKSTLLLQAAAGVARGTGAQPPAQGTGDRSPARGTGADAMTRVLYVSGEEAIEQLRMRADRLGVVAPSVALAAAIDVRAIARAIDAERDAALVVIDSIQTMWLDALESAPGSVAQVRAAGFELIRLAKERGFTLILVGHVTKDGALAGPRVLEHMVDAVLHFEGDRGHQFRILRADKNRFGATDEIGVFEMTDTGLAEVANPSALFLAERRGNVAGSAVFAGVEGTRPVLLEVQALLSPNNGGGAPRRAVVGADASRLAMLLAVLDARCGLKLGGFDIHLNIAGGLRVNEPAADLAVAAALASAAADRPTDADSVYFGEVGLSGEIRQVAQAEARLKEAEKLGFGRAVLPRRVARGGRAPVAPAGLRLQELGHLYDLVQALAPDGWERPGDGTISAP